MKTLLGLLIGVFLSTTMSAQVHIDKEHHSILAEEHNSVGFYFPFVFQKAAAVYYERFFGKQVWSVVSNGIYSFKDKKWELFPELRYHFYRSKPATLSSPILGAEHYIWDVYTGFIPSYVGNSAGYRSYEAHASFGTRLSFDNGLNVGSFGSLGYGYVDKSPYGAAFENKGYVSYKLPFFYLNIGYRF